MWTFGAFGAMLHAWSSLGISLTAGIPTGMPCPALQRPLLCFMAAALPAHSYLRENCFRVLTEMRDLSQ